MEKGLKEALIYLESGNPSKAHQLLSDLFRKDLESREILYTTLCCTFWEDLINRLNTYEDPYERGDILVTEWKNFCHYINRQKGEYRPAFEATQQGIFTLALHNYQRVLEDIKVQDKSEVYQKAGLCFKKTGNYENACNCLIQANNLKSGQAPVLAELADCFSLCGEERQAKVLFREAFFIAPDKIELDHLDSKLIKELIRKTESTGCSSRALPFWIPVYAVIWGVFTVKRVLSSQEVAHLKQSVYAMENELKNPKCDEEILTPALLRNYFWLIDHYVMSENSSREINEILLKIKVTNKAIYELFVK